MHSNKAKSLTENEKHIPWQYFSGTQLEKRDNSFVTDTNFLIDMIDSNLLDFMIRSEFTFIVPDILFYKELQESILICLERDYRYVLCHQPVSNISNYSVTNIEVREK